MPNAEPERGNSPPSYGRLEENPKTVSRLWAAATMVLAILLVVVAVLPFVLTRQSTSVETRVQWHQYSVAGGLGVENVTVVASETYCPISTPMGAVLFALNWTSSSTVPVENVRVWTLVSTDTAPYWKGEVLYQSGSGTSGFASFNPLPLCGAAWFVDTNATATTTVTVTMALTYNYTTTTVEHWPY